MKTVSQLEVLQKLKLLSANRPYLAMYSSLYEGIVTERELMLVPVDEHMVHRGDGVFEAIRVVNGKMYLASAHFARLMKSAQLVGLEHEYSVESLRLICEDVIAVSHRQSELEGDYMGPNSSPLAQQNSREERQELMLRIFLSRGPGDFSPNPYSTVGAQLYIVATKFQPLPGELYLNGASVCFSKVPIKPGVFAQIKSCNYLPNVMMKKESVDRGFDFAIGLNEEGYVAEGPTENICVLTTSNHFVVPPFDYTLRGTTLLRAIDLIEKHDMAKVSIQHIRAQEILAAKEVMMIGTTLGALPITQIEDHRLSARAGQFVSELNQRILNDML